MSHKFIQSRFFKIFIFIFFTFIFWLKGVVFLDPDLGWHLKYGEIILNSGIPSSDPFSYTMSSYNYANHEWLQDVILAKIYSLFGLEGLSLIYSVITIFVIFLSISKLSNSWQYSVLFLQSTIFLSFTGIRPQILTWLFFLIILKILLRKSNRLLLPIIFLVWANLHGGFVIGLFTFLIYLIAQTITDRKIPAKLVSIFTFSILVTLINPYQFRLWLEIYNSLSDPVLRIIIMEWLPLIFSPNPLIIMWFALTIFLVIKFRHRLSFFEKVFYTLLLLSGLSSVRNIPFLILATGPILVTFSEKYYLGLKAKIPPVLFKKIPFSLFLLLMAIFLLAIIKHFQPDNMRHSSYPVDAIVFLQNASLEGELFAPYGWGGYLIWQYPLKKVFIDGRMPSWRFKPPTGNESSDAFFEYRQIVIDGVPFQPIFSKYNIKTILWNKIQKTRHNFFQKVYAVVYSVFNKLIYPDGYKVEESLVNRLEKANWKKIYEDDISVIYQE